jgi:hypothetical protein
MSSVSSSWEKFLNPESLKSNLIVSSLFITSFEIFKGSIIQHPKTFFSDGYDENGHILGDEYKNEVTLKSKSPIYASLKWFLEMKAIDENDMEIFELIKKHRNDVVHEMPDYIYNSSHELKLELFKSLLELFRKIEVWWVINFEMAISPDYDNQEIDEIGITPGPIMSIQLMIDIALGTEPSDGFYYSEFKKKST